MKRKRLCVLGAAGLALACASSPARAQHARDDLAGMSLDSLLGIPVDAAARYAWTVADAPASVTVLTAYRFE